MSKKALILIDFINEIVHPDGKLAGKGYPDFIKENNTKEALGGLLEKFRANGDLIIHVGVGFLPNYKDHPSKSPLFGAAKKFGALNSAEWGCEFVDYATPTDDEAVVRKTRVSAFHNTNLETILRANAIDALFIAGCATDLAVQSAVRDAHDRDYDVTVVLDACAAANADDHKLSIEVMKKIATVENSTNI